MSIVAPKYEPRMGVAFDEGSSPPLVALFSMWRAFRYAVVKRDNPPLRPLKRIVKAAEAHFIACRIYGRMRIQAGKTLRLNKSR